MAENFVDAGFDDFNERIFIWKLILKGLVQFISLHALTPDRQEVLEDKSAIWIVFDLVVCVIEHPLANIGMPFPKFIFFLIDDVRDGVGNIFNSRGFFQRIGVGEDVGDQSKI